ncbi:hypothetical protein Bca52824_016585 [Brassica carinata]|uniref:Uncharacterized protein n=1 Tax=Brassica carinata TaxID=52824 RepID=A0A8X7W5C4_BRACI|nr:hypothetical protein Bca52824_016585 [Brassica carinata]
MDEANPSTIDKSLAPGTEQSPRDADESEEDKNNEDKDVREEHKEPREVEKDAKEGGAEMEVVQMESRNNEEGENPEGEERTTQSVGEPETELHEWIVWTKIIRNGKQVIFEAEFSIDFEARTAQVEGHTIPAIGEPSNNADSGEAHADSVEAPGAEALKAMEARLMNAFQDAMKVLKDEVKSLRVRVDGKSVQLEHGSGDDDMDETLVRYAAAEESKKAKTEKTKSVKNKKKRARTDDGKEVVSSKKAKGCDIGIWSESHSGHPPRSQACRWNSSKPSSAYTPRLDES